MISVGHNAVTQLTSSITDRRLYPSGQAADSVRVYQAAGSIARVGRVSEAWRGAAAAVSLPSQWRGSQCSSVGSQQDIGCFQIVTQITALTRCPTFAANSLSRLASGQSRREQPAVGSRSLCAVLAEHTPEGKLVHYLVAGAAAAKAGSIGLAIP
jgi:hypothetical protein